MQCFGLFILAQLPALNPRGPRQSNVGSEAMKFILEQKHGLFLQNSRVWHMSNLSTESE